MEILIALAIAYLVVAPDRGTLAVTRGLAGAARAGATGRVRSRRPSSHGKPGKSALSVVSPSRRRAILDGWREGVATARARRDEGRDVWSRGSRGAGRVKGGAGSVVGGIRTTVRNRRSAPDSGSAAPETPSGPEPSPSSVSGPDGLHSTDDGPAGPDGTRPGRRYSGPFLVRRNTSDTSTDDTSTTEPATADSETTRKALPTMALNGTDLANIDEVAGEIRAAENAMEELDTAFAELKQWAANLPDRWSATSWGTDGLDAAIAGLADLMATLKGPDVVRDQLAAVQGEIKSARAVGEAAEAAKAKGDLSGFNAA